MPATTFSPKRYLEPGGGQRELKRLATHLNGKIAANVPTITTPNATDLATAQALANQNKATVNALIAALQAANLMN